MRLRYHERSSIQKFNPGFLINHSMDLNQTFGRLAYLCYLAYKLTFSIKLLLSMSNLVDFIAHQNKNIMVTSQPEAKFTHSRGIVGTRLGVGAILFFLSKLIIINYGIFIKIYFYCLVCTLQLKT